MLESLAKALEIRLREVLREDLGAVYGVSVAPSFAWRPRERYSLSITFGCAPDQARELVERVHEVIDDFRRDGPPDELAARVREIQTRAHETDVRENSYWLHALGDVYRRGADPTEILDYAGLVSAVTPEALRKAAGTYPRLGPAGARHPPAGGRRRPAAGGRRGAMSPRSEAPFPLEPDAAEMRRLVDEAMERIVRYVTTLPEQAAGDTAGGVELRPLAGRAGAGGRPAARRAPRAPVRPGGAEVVQRRRPRLPRLRSRRRPLRLGARRPDGGRDQPLHRRLRRRPGAGAARGERAPWFADVVGYPASARGLLTSGGSLAAFTAIVTARRERLPEDFLARHPLRLGPDPPLDPQGGRARRLPGRERAGNPDRHRLPHPPRRPRRGGHRRPSLRPRAVPGRGQRGHRQHRRGRPAAGARPLRPRGGALAPRRRRPTARSST